MADCERYSFHISPSFIAQWCGAPEVCEMKACIVLILLGMDNLCRCWKCDLRTSICSEVTHIFSVTTRGNVCCPSCQLFVIIMIFTNTLRYCLVVKIADGCSLSPVQDPIAPRDVLSLPFLMFHFLTSTGNCWTVYFIRWLNAVGDP